MLDLECAVEESALVVEHHWSLRDVVEYFRHLYNRRDEIDGWIRQFSAMPNQSDVLNEIGRQQLNQYAENLCAFFEPRGFTCALRAARRLQEQHTTLTPAEVSKAFRDLWVDFLSDCDGRLVELIDPDKSKHYDKGVDHEVGQKFPEATKEIQEAGTCYALGRNTACVFHLMRAVEHGIRALAVAVGAPDIGHKVPLEYACWEDLLGRVTSRVNAVSLSSWSAPAKSNFRAFYNGSTADFTAFKDECRNLLMHTRSGLYNQHEAASWMMKVAGFLKRLATKVSEDSTAVRLSERDWL